MTNFAGQWLQLRNLRTIQPDNDIFPDFDDNLRQAFQREIELLFDSIMREDRSVVDLLTADYTFVNERLAKHYGIPNVYGSHFRRVPITDEARKGLLGKGGVLMVTSHANRTSPVVRGKWILDNILGTPPPPPPPLVPALAEKSETGQPRTMREQMEQHRANPVCASCHKLMDPLGFALENFDAIGRWRARDLGKTVDVSSELFDGTKIDGAVDLRRSVLRRSDVFVDDDVGEAAHLRAGPRADGAGHARRAGHSQQGCRAGLSLLVVGARSRRESSVPDDHQGTVRCGAVVAGCQAVGSTSRVR